ncbi:polysaccharide biosynthesis/export family protein [Pedobacter nyackensis]|uniref:polysaccharide biosynthesis/export family protein n=1 Tax=Pedobacter nyackensis TaxID=475255 RepID=UPI00292E51FE|nr:SLBB domain-containing protein [Pedobacter nyackensis]
MHIGNKPALSIAIITSVTLGFSCANKQQQLLFDTKTHVATIKSSNLPKSTHYIQPQDLLQIRNLQNRKYIIQEPFIVNTQHSGADDHLYEVQADSTIALPVLGRVKVAGLNRFEAAKHIEMLYSIELKAPMIALKIVNLKVTLIGEVKNQGNYPLVKDHTSLMEVIGTAGGITDKGNVRNVKIIRGTSDKQEINTFDLSNIKTLSDPGIILQNNDIIYVAQHKKAIRNEKLQSISAILQPVITLLNTVLIIHTLSRR